MRRKVNDYFEFPLELNLEQYTQKYIKKKRILEKLRTGTIENELTSEERTILNFQVPQGYYTYKLCGVIIHMGTASSGHYVSIAMDREANDDNQWYEFNDSFVDKFNLERLAAETFGSRSKNAYMLVYERTKFFDMGGVRKLSEELKTENGAVKASETFEKLSVDYDTFFNVQVPDEMERKITSEDERHKQLKVAINPNLVSLMNMICCNCKYMNQSDYKLVKSLNLQRVPFSSELTEHKEYLEQLEKLQFFTIYLLTVVLRITLKSKYFELLKELRRAAQNDIGFSIWLLETFIHPYILKEFFVNCPNSKSRFVVASLLHAAFINVYQYEEERIEKYAKKYLTFSAKLQSKATTKPFEFPDEENALTEALFLECPKKGLPYCLIFIYNLFALMPRVLDNMNTAPQYFFLLSVLCKERPTLVSFLLELGIFGCLIEILKESIGEFVFNITKQKFIMLNKELSLDFQKVEISKSKVARDLNTTKPKIYRFVTQLLFLVSLFITLDNTKLSFKL